MKVAQNKPAITKSVVYVTPDQYEVWYSKPMSLGTIDKRGGYWYTRDGMRFVSSRDAMEYLIRLYELAQGSTPLVPVEVQISKVTPEAKQQVAKTVTTHKKLDLAASAPKIIKRAGAESGKPSLVDVNDPFIKELLIYLKGNPEVKKLLGKS